MKSKILLFLLCFVAAFAVRAWPTQSINLIVPYNPGGLTDQIARSLAVEIEKNTKQKVLVQYLPGATNLVALNHVARLSNDDHTFILTMDDFIFGSLYQDSNVHKRFTGVYVTSILPYVIISGDANKAKSFQKRVQLREEINLGIVGINSGADLWRKGLYGMNINPVPYKGAAPTIIDLLGGHIDYGILSIGVVKSHIDDGKLHPVMLSSLSRSSVVPNIPSFSEIGFRGPEGITWFTVITRDDTSEIAQRQFSSILQQIYTTAAPLAFLTERGAEVVNWDLHKSRAFVEDQKNKAESRR